MIGNYALSKGAFAKLVEEGFTNPEICQQNGNPDKEMARCLEHLNVIKHDGRDKEGKGRFFYNNPESFLFPEKYNENDKWYWNKLKQGEENCCSDRLIAIQNIGSNDLYYWEYFIYKVRVFGMKRNYERLPQKLSLENMFST